MKKILLLCILLCAAAATFAQTSNAILFTENGERFTAILNGVRQNDKPETNVKVTGLNAEFYKLKVIFENQALGEKNFNLNLQLGNETTYNIRKNNKGEYVLRYVSSVPVAEAPRSTPSQTVVVYQANPAAVPAPVSQQTTTTTTTTTTSGGANPDNVSMNMGVNVDGHAAGISINVSGMEGGTTTSSSQTTVTHSQTTTTTSTTAPAPAPAQVVYLPGYNGPVGCPAPMNPADFSDLKKTIAAKTFEDTKMTIAKQVVGNQCLFTTQVKEILQLFTFEESKLDFAKYAYRYTYDQGNYFKVNDVFTFESSTEELNEYIQSRH